MSCCTCNDDDCMWQFMRSYNCYPRKLFCNAFTMICIISFIGSLLLLAIGCSYYVIQSDPSTYYYQTTEQIYFSRSTYDTVQYDLNCYTNYNYNATELFSCTQLKQNSSLVITNITCVYRSCYQYQQVCQPCYHICSTSNCWVYEQQRNCYKSLTTHKCTVDYQSHLTTYVCDKRYNDSILTCTQECGQLTCQYYEYDCNCGNGACVTYQNKICGVNRLHFVRFTYNVGYTINNKTSMTRKATIKNCNIFDQICIKNQSFSIVPAVILYSKDDVANWILESNFTPRVVPGTNALIILGTIGMVCTVVMIIYLAYMTCADCREVHAYAAETCIICSGSFEGKERTVIKCKHMFHTACISDWFTRQRTCPICRSIDV